MSSWFANARDMLEATRNAAMEVERIRRQISLMESREGPHGGGAGASVSGGRHDVNGTGAVVARMDYERSMRDRLEGDCRLLDATYRLLYGDGSAGASQVAGKASVDVVWWRYGLAASWSEVATATGYSERQCRRMAATAIDILDAYGVERVRDGVGLAEE